MASTVGIVAANAITSTMRAAITHFGALPLSVNAAQPPALVLAALPLGASFATGSFFGSAIPRRSAYHVSSRGMSDDAVTLRVDTSGAALDDDGLAPFTTASGGERYEAGGVIGAGGMGEVRSQLDATGRSVAMKTMHAAHDPMALRRFAREARIQSQLEHPSIIPVYDIGTRDDTPYITM